MQLLIQKSVEAKFSTLEYSPGIQIFLAPYMALDAFQLGLHDGLYQMFYVALKWNSVFLFPILFSPLIYFGRVDLAYKLFE